MGGSGLQCVGHFISVCHQSDAEMGEVKTSLEQSYRETMRVVRAYMNWLEVPEFVETPQQADHPFIYGRE